MSDEKDLSSLTLTDLLLLRLRVNQAIREALTVQLAQRSTDAKAKAEVVALLASFGLKPENLIKRRRSVVAGQKLPPKYRDPANPANTWTGRGAKPRWFREALEAGTPIEAMEIREA
ncbi:H-NS family nucleoid-associated regulatory protein [Rubellimicrobium aerolatum]|uniref:H-NS family nucleoid-associated regulatory protein n=1 Tax=Rubellimicrobium aerolatum TaxID=490979 RepID=A0ABW0SDQ5_9RHOB